MERHLGADLHARIPQESQLPFCDERELDVTLRWEMADDGALHGHVVVVNTGERRCRVGGKPIVTPLAPDGEPLSVQTVVTMELRMPSWVLLRPGERAAAPVRWGAWCGAAASERARVHWQQGAATVAVEGPSQPRCVEGAAMNLTSSWFALVGDPPPENPPHHTAV